MLQFKPWARWAARFIALATSFGFQLQVQGFIYDWPLNKPPALCGVEALPADPVSTAEAWSKAFTLFMIGL